MKASKLKYQLRVLINPSLWLRNGKISQEFDEWMWLRMDEGIQPTLDQSNPLAPTICRANFGGLSIWIENQPYADCTYAQNSHADCAPSRATALRFRELIKPLLKEARRFVPPT